MIAPRSVNNATRWHRKKEIKALFEDEETQMKGGRGDTVEEESGRR